jgi:LmbE family N-acetylglucosaminyl deacetylase
MVTAIEGTGTDERLWRAWPQLGSWPGVPLAELNGAVVVAPHPDDEILGVGGLLRQLDGAAVVAVTDGEASHPDAVSVSAAQLRALRPAESAEALRRLGFRGPVHRLGQPDNGIDEAALTASLVRLLGPGVPCLATWRGDGHPDHEAVGRAAAAACAASGARLYEYPVWLWHWARPGQVGVPWHRACQVPLDAEALAAKRAAIEAFTTQIRPVDGVTILPEPVLARFRRPFEVLFHDR